MSTETIYTALSQSIQSGSIDLAAAALKPALAEMRPLLALFRISPAYMVTEVVLVKTAGGADLVLTGKSSFSSAVTYAADLNLSYSGAAGTFTLQLAIREDWGFSDFFAHLPRTLMPASSVDPAIRWLPSFMTGMKIRSAVFKNTVTQKGPSLELTGMLLEPANTLLLEKTHLIKPWPLRVQGIVEMPDEARNYPLFELDAFGNSALINGGKDALLPGPDNISIFNPGLCLVSATLEKPQPGRNAFSTLELFGDFSLGGIAGRISTLILSTQNVWSFSVQFEKDKFKLKSLSELTSDIFKVDLPIPDNFPVLSDFYIADVDIDLLNTATSALPVFKLLNLGITIRSDKMWNPPVPFVKVNNVGSRWVWSWSAIDGANGEPLTAYTITGSVFGTLNFGEERDQLALPALPGHSYLPGRAINILDEPIRYDISMDFPSFLITGSLAEGSFIPVGQLLLSFFGNQGAHTGDQLMNITKLNFFADPVAQTYFLEGSIMFGNPLLPDVEQGWVIKLLVTTITLYELSFGIAVNAGNTTATISGAVLLGEGDPTDYKRPRLVITAEYLLQDPDAPQGWVLSGYLYPGTSINLTKLIYQFIYGSHQEAPSWVPQLAIDALSVVFTTGRSGASGIVETKPSYTFNGTASVRWEPVIFGTTLKINASATLELKKAATEDSASGSLTGTFTVNRLTLSASLTLGVPKRVYLFKIRFDQLWLQAATSWRGEREIISVQMGGTTLGGILEYLVNLASPNQDFQLDAPWDLLNKVELSKFLLVIDPEKSAIEFTYRADIDLGIAQLDSIGVKYSKETGEGKVSLILTGSFLGKKYDDEKPLSWDVVNDPAPSVAGQGETFLKLRYIGLGQRVKLSGSTPSTVAAAVNRLKTEMKPPPDNGNPLGGMVYSADSQWLIGFDIQLIEAIELLLIFNDSNLYGLSIELHGERAGALAGLRFEILYKKINNQVGMFRIELRVPDKFRTIELEMVSLTLGIVVIEIYTNGNFKIDLGFPYNRKFDRSFSLQAEIFIGRGGFYFGVLNGDTSTNVPKVINGNFSPVIELGIGIAAGVGREFSSGILSGGAFVELEVIFEGVLAWFNPDSSGTPATTYFRCEAVAALHGKLYGSVDFEIIKVSVTLEAYAQVSVIYESYQPMQVELEAEVRAEAEVDCWLFTLYFHFDVNVELEFTIGSAQPTPWILADTTNAPAQPNGEKPFGYHRRFHLLRNKFRRLQAMKHAHMVSLAVNDHYKEENNYTLNWNPSARVFPDSPRKAHLTLLPMFSVGNVPVNWNGTLPVNSNPDYRCAFILFADSGIPTAARTAAACLPRSGKHSGMSGTVDTSQLGADILARGLLKYAVGALPRDAAQGNTITAGQVAILLEQLNMPETLTTGLSINNIKTFFESNIRLWISGKAEGSSPDPKSGMVLPVPPFLSWTSTQAGPVNFSSKNKVGPWYRWGISDFLNDYAPVPSSPQAKPAVDDPLSYESFTSFLFRDFCQMVIKNGVREMQRLLNNTQVIVGPGTGQSLTSIAASFPAASIWYNVCAGDTMDSVAESLGATPDELVFLNSELARDLKDKAPGTRLLVRLGISPEVLAMENTSTVFTINQCTLGNIVYQASVSDTLQSIATLFQVTDVATLLRYDNTDLPVLSSGADVLRAEAVFDLPARTFSNPPAGAAGIRIAAIFFARYKEHLLNSDPVLSAMANWYVQAIAVLNPALAQHFLPAGLGMGGDEILPGYTFKVPNAYNYQDNLNTNDYTAVAGDTLYRIGFTLVLQQDFTTTAPAGFAGWTNFRNGITPAPAGGWLIPAQAGIMVQAGVTIRSLVRQLVIDADWQSLEPVLPPTGTWIYHWEKVAVWLANADVLLPLACITVPAVTVTNAGPLSFGMLSNRYGLAVSDLASRLSAVNLFAEETILQISLLPVQDIDILIDKALQSGFTSIINQSSRMLMSGSRLPALMEFDGHTIADKGNLRPLYDLTGQQFSFPLNNTQPDAIALAVSVTATPGNGMITLLKSIVVQTGQTLAGLQALYPELMTYNPGLNQSSFATGMVLLTGPVGASLDYSYTNAEVVSEVPATALAVTPQPPGNLSPSVIPVKGRVPKTYGLKHRTELQTPVALPIPQSAEKATVTGNPGLWAMPHELQLKAQSGMATRYEILSVASGGDTTTASKVASSTFATALPFKIKKLDGVASSFELGGVDNNSRATLLILRKWLIANPGNTRAFLLLAPQPNAVNSTGLTVLPVAQPADCFLIKTNLSTISVPPAFRLDADPAPGIYFAGLSSLADFLLLLWEGTVVGGSGYYFNPGATIPAGAFDPQGDILLQLLVIAGPQQSLAPGGRTLLPFNNCILTGGGVDCTGQSLFIESIGTTDASEFVEQALLPPGAIGFDLLLANPGSVTPSLETRLKKLYSLLSFEIINNGSSFKAAYPGMPALPDPSDGLQLEAWEKARNKRERLQNTPGGDLEPKNSWEYRQVLPVNRFTIEDNTLVPGPDVMGLPEPKLDPFLGFGTKVSIPVASFVFGFVDLLGNRTGSNGPGQGTLDIPVGYTDNLIGIGEWPSITRHFSISPGPLTPRLTTTIAARPVELIPSHSQSGDVYKDLLIQQQKRLSQIYYQLIQPNMSAYIVTSLDFISDPDYGNKGIQIADISPLWKFIGGAYATARTLSLFEPAKPVAAHTLSNVTATYGVSYNDLALANLDRTIDVLFGSSILTIPAYRPFIQHSSVATLFNHLPDGWPRPASAPLLLQYRNNTVLPLRTGAEISIPVTTKTTGSESKTLATIAVENNTGFLSLALANADNAILKNGFEIIVELDDTTEAIVTVDEATNNFTLVVAAFKNQGVHTSVAELASLYKESSGLLRSNLSLSLTTYLVADRDTLSSNQSGLTVAQLAEANSNTPDLFDPGAMIYFGDFTPAAVSNPAPALRQFADRYSCPAHLLLAANADTVLPAMNGFIIPGTLAWPLSTAGMKVPYTIRDGDTLSAIAGRFAFDTTVDPAVASLVKENQAMPGLIRARINIIVNVAGTPVTINTGSSSLSFASVFNLLKQAAPAATMSQLVTAIGGSDAVLQNSGLLLCPPAKFIQACKPALISQLYGIDPAAFAFANAAMQNLVAGGKMLNAPSGVVWIPTSENDTLNSLIAKFALLGVKLTAGDILTANMDIELIRSGALALIPPADIRFTVDINHEALYASPVEALTVSLRLIRPRALINPAFATPHGTGPVEMALSDFPVPAAALDGDLTYNNFIITMLEAFTNLRLATGKLPGSTKDLWQVDFGTKGIKQVKFEGATGVTGQKKPRFFALRPLYNYLVNRTVPIFMLKSDGSGTLENSSEDIVFQGVDVERWARRFIEDMDRFLSGPFALAVYSNPNTRAHLQALLDVKALLTLRVAAGLYPVLNVIDEHQAALANARLALQQQLGVSLAKTYEATVMVQYNSVADTAWQRNPHPKPAALYGNGIIVQAAGDDRPVINIIAAKTDLAQADAYVNFLITQSNASLSKNITGSLQYDVSHLECNITTSDVPEDYVASDWLTFVQLQSTTRKPAALERTDPGAVNIPIPLRTSFPTLPRIVSQKAVQPYGEGTVVANMSHWDYVFEYSHEHAAQDYVNLTVEFNLVSPPVKKTTVDSKDLFSELAQYMTVADQLWELLYALTDPGSSSSGQAIENAVQTYSSLVSNICDKWLIRMKTADLLTHRLDLITGASQYKFNARAAYHGNGALDTYTLTALDNPPVTENRWPEVWLETMPGHFTPLVRTITPNSAVYQVPADVPAMIWPVFRLVWKDLNLAVKQNARSNIKVTRNQDLIEGIATNEDFVFSTGMVVSPGIVTPLNTYSRLTDITSLGNSLTQALNTCFNNLFFNNKFTQRVTFELGYGFNLVAPSLSTEGLVTFLPIGLYPDQVLSASTAETISAALEQWRSAHSG